MRTVFRLNFILFILLISNTLFCQDKHLVYSGEIYTVSYKGSTKESPEAIYRHEKGIHNILIFDDNKSMFYRESNTYDNPTNDSTIKSSIKNYQITLSDKKKKASKIILITYDKSDRSVNIDKNSDKKWTKIKPTKEKKQTKEDKAFFGLLESQHGIKTTFSAPEIVYTPKAQKINGYDCKNAIVTDNSRIYTVWYTEEMNYNWCFEDYRYLIPGTVIKIEYNNETYLEFVRIEDLDYSKISLNKKIVDGIIDRW